MMKVVVYFSLLALVQVSPIEGRGTWSASVGNYEYYASPSTTYKSYNNSLEACRKMDGELASITSAKIQSFLNNLVTNDALPYAFYVGLQYLTKDKTFVWDNGELLNYTNWATNEPNSVGAEKCVVAGELYTYHDNLIWHDFPCDNGNTPTGFFCQRLIGKIWANWGEWSKCSCPGHRQRVRNCIDSGRPGPDSCMTSGELAFENGTCWTPECNVTTPATTTTARPLGRGNWFASGSFEYYVSAAGASFSYALSQSKCKDEDGELALVKSPQVQTFISSLVSDDSGIPFAFYIGLRFEKTEFLWSDGSPLEYQRWQDGEPNRNTINSEDCVGVGYLYYYIEGLPWHDYPCIIGSSGKKGRVCQRRIGTYWGPWSEWSLCNCSVTNQSRDRTCVDTTREGPDDCTGSTNEARQCSLEPSCYTTTAFAFPTTDPTTTMEEASTTITDETASTEQAVSSITLQVATTSSTYSNDQTTKFGDATTHGVATIASDSSTTVRDIAIPTGPTPIPTDEAPITAENSTSTTTAYYAAITSDTNTIAVSQTAAATEAENVDNTSATDIAATFPDIVISAATPTDESSVTSESTTSAFGETLWPTTTLIESTTNGRKATPTAEYATTVTLQYETRKKATSDVTLSMEHSTVPVTIGMIISSAPTTADTTLSTSTATNTKTQSTTANTVNVASSELSGTEHANSVGSSRPSFHGGDTTVLWSTRSQELPVTSDDVPLPPTTSPQASFIVPLVGAIAGCIILAIIVVPSIMLMKHQQRKRGRAVISTSAFQLNTRRSDRRSLTDDERHGVVLEHFSGGAADDMGYGAGSVNQMFTFLNDETENVNIEREASTLDESENSTTLYDNVNFLPDDQDTDHIDVNGDTYAVVKRANKSPKSVQDTEN